MSVPPIPQGYHTLTPYLTAKNADRLIEFLEKAFKAQVMEKTVSLEGIVQNCEIKIGDSMLMVGEARDAQSARPSTIYMYLVDPDLFYKNAMELGAKSLREPEDQFYGDRCGGVEDFAGNHWWVAKRLKNVSPEEVAQQMAAQKK